MTYLDLEDDVNYHGHTFMALDISNPIPDDDWVLDSGACRSMTKDRELFVEYTPLPKPITFSAASGDPLIAYGIGTVRIRMEYMDVDIKKIYYIPTVVTNLLCAKELFAADYRPNLQPDLSLKLTDPNGNLAGFAISMDGLYVISTRRPQVFAALPHDPLHLWYLRLGHLHYRAVSDITKIPMKKAYPPCHPCLAGK
jgi:hypothetical protein